MLKAIQPKDVVVNGFEVNSSGQIWTRVAFVLVLNQLRQKFCRRRGKTKVDVPNEKKQV
jgi:hypothetical protein